MTMTRDERLAATIAYCKAHQHEWDAWEARPFAERYADMSKVEAATEAHGVLAGRAMMKALGIPTIPDELCDPVEELEAKYQADKALCQAAGLAFAQVVDH